VSVFQTTINVRTEGKGFSDLGRIVAGVVAESGIQTGLCSMFVRHTSASLVIQENADPAVLRDLAIWMEEIAPESRDWEHDDEGPDDMPSHVRSAITKTAETVPVSHGKLALGTWQGIYLWEHRTDPKTREIVVHISGE
jgi:secondary thiamine-phosphate synthase enzyme